MVKQALMDSVCGKELSVYGMGMKLFRGLTKLLPHAWLLHAEASLNALSKGEKKCGK